MEINSMTAKESFGLFIESAGPRREAKQLREQLGKSVLETIRETWSEKIIILETNRRDIEDALGKPDFDDSNLIGYELSQRAGYFYTFEFEPARQRLIQSGYRRMTLVQLPVPLPANGFEWEEFSRQAAIAGVTASEIEMLLGKPIDHYGWFPVETWEYPHGAITFYNGIVVDVEEESEISNADAETDAEK